MAAIRRTDIDAVALAHIQHGDLDPGGLSSKEDQAEEGAGDITGDPGKSSGREEEDEQAGIEKKDLPQLRRAGTKQADAPGGTQTAERLVQEKDSLYGKRGGSEKRQPFPAGGKKQPAQGGQKDTASQKRSHERDHYQIDGDGFLVDGQIRIFGVMDQHHDMECAPYTPAGLSYPSRQPANIQQAAREQIQRIFDLLHMKMGAFNFEYIVDESGQVYVLEIGPRNGGNLIPDTLKAACGVDLAEYTVKIAVGDDCSDLRQLPAKTCATSYILHSDRDGRFCRVEIGETLRGEILKQAVFVNPGDPVRRFRNASMGIGAMVLAYPDVETMCSQMDHMSDHIHVVTEPHKNVTAAENDNEEQK